MLPKDRGKKGKVQVFQREKRKEMTNIIRRLAEKLNEKNKGKVASKHQRGSKIKQSERSHVKISAPP